MQLHQTLLSDEGNPDLDGHRDNILNQINTKLEILNKILAERKILMPHTKPKSVKTKAKSSKLPSKAMMMTKVKTEVTKRVEVDENGNLKMKEMVNEINPDLDEELKKLEDAERAIREMEASKGKLNYHQISEAELAEVASIDSSNIDYVDQFSERLDHIDQEIQRLYVKINGVHELIQQNDQRLQDTNKKSVAEVQQYCFTLHQEIEDLSAKLKKQHQTGKIFNEEVVKKLDKVSLEIQDEREFTKKKSHGNYSMLLSSKSKKEKDRLNASNSNPATFHLESSKLVNVSRDKFEISCASRRKVSKAIEVREIEDLTSNPNQTDRDILMNSAIRKRKNTPRSNPRQEQNFPNIRK